MECDEEVGHDRARPHQNSLPEYCRLSELRRRMTYYCMFSLRSECPYLILKPRCSSSSGYADSWVTTGDPCNSDAVGSRGRIVPLSNCFAFSSHCAGTDPGLARPSFPITRLCQSVRLLAPQLADSLQHRDAFGQNEAEFQLRHFCSGIAEVPRIPAIPARYSGNAGMRGTARQSAVPRVHICQSGRWRHGRHGNNRVTAKMPASTLGAHIVNSAPLGKALNRNVRLQGCDGFVVPLHAQFRPDLCSVQRIEH